MPKKFDTNPLDPEFPEKVKAAGASADTTPEVSAYEAPTRTRYATAEFPAPPPSITEDETRRFQEADLNAYAFQGGQVPAAYQPRPVGNSDMSSAGQRIVPKAGVAEKWLVGLPYLPFWFGMVAGLVLLLLMPKEENKVRFHAAQGLAAQVGILAVTTVLGIIAGITDTNFGSIIFSAVTTVMMIVFAVKAFRGKPVHLEIIDDLTNWLEEKIGPIKSQ